MAKSKTRAKAKPKSKRPAGGPRASWNGNLSFGLVTFPVQALNAASREQGDIHFHQLHAGCHRRIRHQKVCPVHGEVANDEIVSGYEYKKNHYIEVDPDELDALRTQRERALTIDAFVDPDDVDPLYFDGRMYYLLPQGAVSKEPYAVMAAALEREGKYGIGQLVFSGREQLALIRPVAGLLHMAMLNYDEEIRAPADVAAALKSPRGLTRQVKLAQSLIRSWSAKDFDFTEYDDPYRERIQELIDAKRAGRQIAAPEEEEETPEIVNLMEALKQSLSRTGKQARAGRTHPKRRTA
jgi:DNA end-binding protein Ku